MGALDPATLQARLSGEDLPAIARDLLGWQLVAGDLRCTIVETEAYHESEPACHGYLGRTPRAAKLRRPAGSAYVYLSYGIHRLVNVVCGPSDVASAVLIRGIEIIDGPDDQRRGVPGPGRVGTVLGATLEHDGLDLLDSASPWQLLPRAVGTPLGEIGSGPRIGISKAVDLPWRFWVVGSPGVSRAPRPSQPR